MKKELLKGLTEEQIAKVKACKSQESLLALAKEEGIELSEEQLEAVSGGGCFSSSGKCGKCGSKDIKETYHNRGYAGEYYTCKCRKCGHSWNVYIN